MSRRSRYSRAESLDRAMDLFWSRGYLGTSMKDLEAVSYTHLTLPTKA